MSLPLGPQLIGQVEKSLNALLERHIAGRLSEREWVTLRLAASADGTRPLAQQVADRARFGDAAELVTGLRDRGLLAGDAISPAGDTLVADVRAAIDAEVGPVWEGLDADEVAAAERVLNEVLHRARALLV